LQPRPNIADKTELQTPLTTVRRCSPQADYWLRFDFAHDSTELVEVRRLISPDKPLAARFDSFLAICGAGFPISLSPPRA
jgi:hypothetical protein